MVVQRAQLLEVPYNTLDQFDSTSAMENMLQNKTKHRNAVLKETTQQRLQWKLSDESLRQWHQWLVLENEENLIF